MSPANRQEILLTMINSGHPAKTIARRFNVSSNTVYVWKRRLIANGFLPDLPDLPNPEKLSREAEIIRLAKEGKFSRTATGKLLGCSNQTVANLEKKLGIVRGLERQTQVVTLIPPKAPIPSRPLSPAMRHLARFDSIIHTVLLAQKEEGTEVPPQVSPTARTLQPNLKLSKKPFGLP